MFGGAFVVDHYALAFAGLLPRRRRTSSLLLSVDYIGDGDYYQGEFYVLLLTSVLGMMVMASARDLITIFVALETISIPTFVLAGWRKHDPKSNEAAIKYYLIGVLVVGGDALRHVARLRRSPARTLLVDIAADRSARRRRRRCSPSAIFLTIVGFAFKVERGAVPLLGARHLRGRAHAGHRVPLGRVEGRRVRRAAHDHHLRVLPVARTSWQPVLWVLAAASMILGNLVALRQTNIVRMLAYSSIAQGGFILVPFAVARRRRRRGAVVVRGRSSSTSSSTAR